MNTKNVFCPNIAWWTQNKQPNGQAMVDLKSGFKVTFSRSQRSDCSFWVSPPNELFLSLTIPLSWDEGLA